MNKPLIVVHPTSTVLARLGEGDLLNDAERARLHRLRRPPDRDDFRAAHHLARHLAGEWLDLDPATLDLEQRCPHCDRPHGRPTVLHDGRPAPVQVSWAHSHGWVAAAAADRRVGVDVEARLLTPDALTATAPTVCTPTELRLLGHSTDPAADFALLWVVKEALVKAGAAGLDDLARVDASAALTGSDQPGLHETSVLGCRVWVSRHPQPHAVALAGR